jgi:DNA-binding transcriptional LysR family regulator
MFILDRIVSRSSRSLAAMIGFSRAAFGHARGGHSGSPDDDAVTLLVRPIPLPPLFSPHPVYAAVRRNTSGGNAFFPKGDGPWIVEHS